MKRRILVPIDFSEHAARALSHALSLVDGDAEVILLHVYEPPRFARPDLVAWGQVDGKMMPLAQMLKDEARQKLDLLIDETSQSTRAQLRGLVQEGRAARAIIDTAENESCEMIVLSTHGRSGFGRFMLGSVTEAVVRGARVPVMTVPPPRE